MKTEERFETVINYFSEAMLVAETELEYTDPYELIVAVILSAQCTDKRVNLITPPFFQQFPDAATLASAMQEKVFELIKSCSYPNNKAKHLRGMASMLDQKFQGVVPDTLEELQKLPGVGRKTANVILSVVFQKPAMAVDTHVFRVAARIGLSTGARNPYETEMQLIKHIPEEKIPLAHHWLILHGRYICTARKPACEQCGIRDFCRYVNKK
ncbi:MAG: endonuclease III [Bacteroidetes bacterium]|nr:MAG: endonuclease III [Bacteroidota bacterium]